MCAFRYAIHAGIHSSILKRVASESNLPGASVFSCYNLQWDDGEPNFQNAEIYGSEKSDIYIYYIHIFLICTAREAVSTQVGGQLANPTATVEGSEGATTVRGVCTIYTPYRSRECWPRANLPTASGKLVVLAVYAFGGDPLIGANWVPFLLILASVNMCCMSPEEVVVVVVFFFLIVFFLPVAVAACWCMLIPSTHLSKIQLWHKPTRGCIRSPMTRGTTILHVTILNATSIIKNGVVELLPPTGCNVPSAWAWSFLLLASRQTWVDWCWWDLLLTGCEFLGFRFFFSVYSGDKGQDLIKHIKTLA